MICIIYYPVRMFVCSFDEETSTADISWVVFIISHNKSPPIFTKDSRKEINHSATFSWDIDAVFMIAWIRRKDGGYNPTVCIPLEDHFFSERLLSCLLFYADNCQLFACTGCLTIYYVLGETSVSLEDFRKHLRLHVGCRLHRSATFHVEGPVLSIQHWNIAMATTSRT